KEGFFPQNLRITASKLQDLRYGENPAQKGAFYLDLEAGRGTLGYARQLQGKELSYNNWMDMDAAWEIVKELDAPACVIIKHTNPCGAALGHTVLEAYERALASDPVSAFGGIIACNSLVDEETAKAIQGRFFEVIVAPGFSPAAKEILAAKTNLRLMEVSGEEGSSVTRGWKIRTVNGGFLVQEEDRGTTPLSEWQTVSVKQPTEEDLRQLEFVWKVCKHVKSNAIVVGKDYQILGVGAGQMNRVGSAQIALEQAGERVRDGYLASDAFFPFADSIELAHRFGIKAIVQPGGSIRDEEVIQAADKAGLILVTTGRRHFKH
ncbi:MAG: bifunctional phosphoribosylaminoimidazolecarboxamide formyltransferase/IMP cyclohydrolase, partial [Peptococcaceae bacterium]|nr:bifunctional phosphoribosylaminoimidazolecarboxamide formyltransferase/IMP cyclohydrolase [Peptococcaceae bacterium]